MYSATTYQPVYVLQLCSATKRKRCRKRSNKVMNKGELALTVYHAEIQEMLKRNYFNLIAAAKSLGIYPLQSDTSTHGITAANLVALCNLDALVAVDVEAEPLQLDSSGEDVDLFGHVVCNDTDSVITVNAWSCQFVIPSQSSFLLSDFSKLELLVAYTGCKRLFDLIVIDPPWENRSVKRGSKYEVLCHGKLLELPIKSLAAAGALIVVWVTNKRRLASYVEDVLFPAWGVQKVAEWHWIKVTCAGELVMEMDSQHKKPYETIILGKASSPTTQLVKCGEVYSSDSESSSPPLKRLKCSLCTLPTAQTVLPNAYSIVCTASKLHSQKPYLGDLLKEYVCQDPVCLELFARNLHRGWISWGNEVLKMQQIPSS